MAGLEAYAEDVDQADIDAFVEGLCGAAGGDSNADLSAAVEPAADDDDDDDESLGHDDFEDVLLEPSDTIDVEAARTGAGLAVVEVDRFESEVLTFDPYADEPDAAPERSDDRMAEAEVSAAVTVVWGSIDALQDGADAHADDEDELHESGVELTEADLIEPDLTEPDLTEPDRIDPDPIELYLEEVARTQASVDALEIEVETTDDEAAAFLDRATADAMRQHEQEDQPDDRAGEASGDDAEDAARVQLPEYEVAANVDPLRVPSWHKLNTSAYAFVRGLRGMAQSPLVQLLAIGTMAVCMLLLGTTTLIFHNAKRVVHDLGIDTPVTVYMAPGIEGDAAERLRERIAALPEVEQATRVSPEQALARLQEGLGTGSTSTVERGALLEGIEAETLPESVEVALIADVEPGFADALAGRVQSMDGVEEVSVLGPWVQEVESMLSTLRWLAFGAAGLVSLACLAIVWSTIRLGVFARRSEIQILRLVGGTHRFVRGPFVVEGVLQGVLGTALALSGLWLAFELTRPFLERGMSLLFAAGSLQFFSMIELGLALGFGALLGLIGSRAAIARHAEG